MKEQIEKLYEIAKRNTPVGSDEMRELEFAYRSIKIPERQFNSNVIDYGNHKEILYKMVDANFSKVPMFLLKSGIVSATYYYHKNNLDAKMTFDTVLMWIETCGYELTLRKKND